MNLEELPFSTIREAVLATKVFVTDRDRHQELMERKLIAGYEDLFSIEGARFRKSPKDQTAAARSWKRRFPLFEMFYEKQRRVIRAKEFLEPWLNMIDKCDSFQLIKTTTSTKLLDAYAGAVYPAAFRFLTGHEDIGRLQKLTAGKTPLIKSKIDRQTLRAMLRGNGILSVLSDEAKKLINDLTHLVNLISFGAMTKFEFSRIDQEPEVWENQLETCSPAQRAAVKTKYQESREILQQGQQSIREKKLTWEQLENDLMDLAKGLFTLRVGHLGLVELMPNNDKQVQFEIEGNEMKKIVQRGNFDGFFTVGRRSYVSWAMEYALPLFAVHNNSLQLVCREEGFEKIKTGKRVNIPVDDAFGESEWYLYQDLALKRLGIQYKRAPVPDARYDEMAKMMMKGEVDLATVAIPMDLHSERFCYYHFDAQDVIAPAKEHLPTVWVVVAKEFAKNHPELVVHVVDKYEQKHKSLGTWPRPEFTMLKQTAQLSDYYAKSFALSTNTIEDVIVSPHLKQVRVEG